MFCILGFTESITQESPEESADQTKPRLGNYRTMSTAFEQSSTEVIKLFPCTIQLSMKFILLINVKINSLRAPDKFLHAPKRNFFKPYSNESLCPKTQKNILCFIIESFVAMETLYELCKTDIWSRISVAQNIVFFSNQELY